MAIEFLKTLRTISDSEKKEKSLSSEDLWLIQYELETQGPYHVTDLRQIMDSRHDELSECMACNMKSKKWKPFFHHSTFQKRKEDQPPPLIKAEEKAQSSFMLLIAGQKLGPYSASRINDLIDKDEIRMNSLISADNGKTWRKVYQYPRFDRRSSENNIVVSAPKEEEFEKSKVFTKEYLQQLKEEGGSTNTAIEGALVARHNHINEQVNKAVSTAASSNAHNSDLSFGMAGGFESAEEANILSKQNIVRAAIVLMLFVLGGSFFIGGNKKSSKRTAKRSKVITKDSDSQSTSQSNSRATSSKSNYKKPSSKRKRSAYSSRSRSRNIDNDDISVPSRSKYRVNPEPEVIEMPEPDYRPSRSRPRPRRQASRRSRDNIEEEPLLIDETLEDEMILEETDRGLAADDDFDGPELVDGEDFDPEFDGADIAEDLDSLDF